MTESFVRLSRAISYVLRHHPERLGLTLDKDGWVGLDALAGALAMQPQWVGLTGEDVLAMMAAAEKRRFELRGSSIRAIYGHSLAGKIEHEPAVPPDLLYHGTTPGVLTRILHEGLKPMRRHYVHLSLDTDSAASVARRRTPKPVIVTINAKKAHQDGVNFHRGNSQIWLAEPIAARYLTFPKGLAHS